MAHSYVKIWIHSIWSTKNRQSLIHQEVEDIIYGYMRGQYIDTGCKVRIINGMPDHVHSLFLLNPNKSIAEVINQVKGCTSHSINQNEIIPEKFSWQTGYAAFSVSESAVDRVEQYIINQKHRHSERSFEEEYERLLTLYGFVEV